MKKALTRTPGGFKFGQVTVGICGEWQDRIFGAGNRATLSDDHFALSSDRYDKRVVTIVPAQNGYTYAILDGEQAIVDGALVGLFTVRGALVTGFYTLFTPKGKVTTEQSENTKRITEALDAINKLAAKIEGQREEMNSGLDALDSLTDTLLELRDSEAR